MPEYLKVDGHDVYCYEWDNDGEAVVLLHGGLSKTASWDYLLVPALEDDFHVLQLIGCQAHLIDGDLFGEVSDVLNLPGQDVLVIKVDGAEVLIPFVRALVPVVDITARRLTVIPPEIAG